MAEIIDVADGLWVWRTRHPGWTPGEGWDSLVTSTCLRSGTETVLVDPLAPPPGCGEAWARIDADPPTLIAVLKPDHVRDVDLFARRYGARPFGPHLFYRDDVPRTELEPIAPGDELPGGLVALRDGRERQETPIWCPQQRALVFADALTAPEPDGVLRVWDSPAHEQRVLPALRALLELDFEHVIVSHGAPVHDRGAFERALTLPPHR